VRGALLTRGLESAWHGPALVQRPFRRLSVCRRLPCLRKLHEARRSRARRQVAFRMRLQEDQDWYRSLLCARLVRVSVQSSGSAHALLSRRALMREASGRPRRAERERPHALKAGGPERAQRGPEAPLAPTLFPVGACARRGEPRSGPRAPRAIRSCCGNAPR